MSRSVQFIVCCSLLLAWSCSSKNRVSDDDRTRVVFDTDANNELDDQHALAYLLFNTPSFKVEGVTVNATHSGGDIDQQYAEAVRVMKLARAHGKIPVMKGADASFSKIVPSADQATFDGSDAVNFIIAEANKSTKKKLVVLAVGKLTNVALALKKDPLLADKIRLVWLGSNYPRPGEYNQDNDTVAMNFLLNSKIPFEMVTVRYGEPTGTAAVTASKSEIELRMPGKGPALDQPVEGRHGGEFSNFGDYSVNLFQHIDYHDSLKTRALFDMVAVAIVKDPSWGSKHEIPAPVLIDNTWVERPENTRMITIWENFDKEKIMNDFYNSMDEYHLIE